MDVGSYILGGFECSTHRRLDGRRLDLIDATQHEKFALQDYRRLADLGFGAARDGLRWHIIETSAGKYDFRSVEEQTDAAQQVGIRVIWDLFHYGFPEHIDIFSADMPQRFAEFAAAFAEFHRSRTGSPPSVVPVNEISFFAWVGGDIGEFYPYEKQRGDELKLQLVRASISAIRALRSIEPDTCVISSEPAVNVIARPHEPWFSEEAENYRRSQFQAIDMITGRLRPELGGHTDHLDMIGVNYYPHNQWYFPDREMIPLDDPHYRSLNSILLEIYERYDTPILITETGTEDERRETWFRYVAAECEIARNKGVDLRGICLYPIVNHPGWVDDRHCLNGLWDYPDEQGNRPIYEPLALEVKKYLGKAARAANF